MLANAKKTLVLLGRRNSLDGTGVRIGNMLARRASIYGLGKDPNVFR